MFFAHTYKQRICEMIKVHCILYLKDSGTLRTKSFALIRVKCSITFSKFCWLWDGLEQNFLPYTFLSKWMLVASRLWRWSSSVPSPPPPLPRSKPTIPSLRIDVAPLFSPELGWTLCRSVGVSLPQGQKHRRPQLSHLQREQTGKSLATGAVRWTKI